MKLKVVYMFVDDRGKSQGRGIELTGSEFKDKITRGDGTVGITKLVDESETRTKR